MSSKYSAQERLKLIERVILGGEPVARVCRAAGISRVLFYRWLKKYKESPGTIEVLVPGKRKPATTQPQKRKIAAKAQKPKVLSPEEKLALIKRVEAGEEVADVCREVGISRTIFYRWQKCYEQAAPEEKFESLKAHKRHIEHYWRQAPEKYEQAVLSLVVQHPEYGIRNLVAHLPQVAGVPLVGHHGVQNILRRHHLSLYEQRLAYAQAQVTPVMRLISTWEQAFARFFAFPLETRQAIVRFVGTTALSLFTTVVVLGSLGYFATVFGTAAPVYRPGLVFASIALLVGMIFFAYSMKYYFTLALVLSFSTQSGPTSPEASRGERNGGGWLARIFGIANGSLRGLTSLKSSTEVRPPQAGGLQPNLDHIKLGRYPFISIHLPLYNEEKVANRILSACTSFDYPHYEIIVCDDSTDETVQIVNEWKNHSRVKILHRPTREGFKGGALREALKHMDPKTEFVIVFDADFVPYPDTLTQFMKYFKATGGWEENKDYKATPYLTMPYQTNEKVEISPSQQLTINHQSSSILSKNSIACIAGYQWHVLNKSENWITRGVRTEYAGSYVVERPGQEILGALKIIHGSVYCIRADILKHFGWGTSITEDFELTLRIYEKGFKVCYTPYIQAPSECVSTIKRLIRQRMRWAEGHSFNVKRRFMPIITSPLMTLTEKLEFLYISPYYLQAFFFLVGTFSWLISEIVFPARLPFWTSLWGWSLVLTNFLALPLMNAVGMFLEESEEKDYLGLLSFVALSYLLVPFQAYATVKGFIESREGPWFRTPKTGLITDIFTRGRFYRWISGILPGRIAPVTRMSADGSRLAPIFSINQPQISGYQRYVALATANNRFNGFQVKPKRTRWISKIVLVILLVTSVTLFSLTGGVPEVLATPISGTFNLDSIDSTLLSGTNWKLLDNTNGTDATTTILSLDGQTGPTGRSQYYPGTNRNPPTVESSACGNGVADGNGWIFETPFQSGGQIANGTWTFYVNETDNRKQMAGTLEVCVYKITISGASISSSTLLFSQTDTTDVWNLDTNNISFTSSQGQHNIGADEYLYVEYFLNTTAVGGGPGTVTSTFGVGPSNNNARITTPTVTIPENVVILLAIAPFIPMMVLWLRRRRRLALI